MINYDDFKKIEMKVAKIITAERVEGSEKLLRLDIDLGAEQRQLVAGIGKSYNPEDLAGKKIIVVVNLEPRKLMGLESNGMLLAAHDEAGPILLVPDGEAVPGAGIN
jgi:methionine--tRNA ligase beta chain